MYAKVVLAKMISKIFGTYFYPFPGVAKDE